MNSERQKRQKEVERFLRETDKNHEADVAFQEEVRRTAAAIIEKEAGRFQEKERARRRKRSITPVAVGVWLLVLGAAAFIVSMPGLATAFFLCGIAGVAWPTFSKPFPPPPRIRENVRAYRRMLKKSFHRFFKRTS
jgi:hypothetical protein